MLKHTKNALLLFLVPALLGCFGLFDNDTDKIVDDYEVGWIDLQENRNLSKHEELIPAFVFAVGHNSKFIYAKQHPLLKNAVEKIDSTITNYYIIERTQNEFQDKPQYGPLTKPNFDSLCLKFGISNPNFDMNYSTKL